MIAASVVTFSLVLAFLKVVGAQPSSRYDLLIKNGCEAARADEITRMRALVKEALQRGAVGMSAGLEYGPGRWSTTEELVDLAKELPAFNGIYISHGRSEGSKPL